MRFLRLILSRRAAVVAMATMTALMVLGSVLSDPGLAPDRVEALRRTRPVAAFLAERLAPGAIAVSPPFVALAALVFVSTSWSIIDRIAQEVGRRRGRGLTSLERHQARRVLEVAGDPAVALDAARAEAVRERFWVEALDSGHGEGTLTASRGSVGFAGSIVFHAGLLVVLVGVGVSSMTRASADLTLVEGFPVELGPEPLAHVTRRGAFESLRGMTIAMRDFTAEFSRGFEPVDFACVLDVGRAGSTSARLVRVNEPSWVGDFELTLHRYGFAPELEVVDRAGREVLEGTAILTVLPPGTEDGLALPDGSELRISFYPDHVLRDGRDDSRSLSPLDPRLVVRRVRGSIELARGAVARGAAVDLGDVRLSFPALHYWAEFVLARDLGVWWIAVGAALVAVGLVLRFLFDPLTLRASVASRPGGTTLELVVTARYFPTLNEERADRIRRRVAERLDGAPGEEAT